MAIQAVTNGAFTFMHKLLTDKLSAKIGAAERYLQRLQRKQAFSTANLQTFQHI